MEEAASVGSHPVSVDSVLSNDAVPTHFSRKTLVNESLNPVVSSPTSSVTDCEELQSKSLSFTKSLTVESISMTCTNPALDIVTAGESTALINNFVDSTAFADELVSSGDIDPNVSVTTSDTSCTQLNATTEKSASSINLVPSLSSTNYKHSTSDNSDSFQNKQSLSSTNLKDSKDSTNKLVSKKNPVVDSNTILTDGHPVRKHQHREIVSTFRDNPSRKSGRTQSGDDFCRKTNQASSKTEKDWAWSCDSFHKDKDLPSDDFSRSSRIKPSKNTLRPHKDSSRSRRGRGDGHWSRNESLGGSEGSWPGDNVLKGTSGASPGDEYLKSNGAQSGSSEYLFGRTGTRTSSAPLNKKFSGKNHKAASSRATFSRRTTIKDASEDKQSSSMDMQQEKGRVDDDLSKYSYHSGSRKPFKTKGCNVDGREHVKSSKKSNAESSEKNQVPVPDSTTSLDSKHSEKDRSWIVRGFNRNELQSMVRYPSTVLPNFIHSHLKRFIKTLNLQQIHKQRELDFILNILYKLAKCVEGGTRSKACLIIPEVLSERCAQFLLQLRLYSTSNYLTMSGCTCIISTLRSRHNSTTCRVRSLCCFFQKILETFPSMSWKVLPICEFTNNIKMIKIVIPSDVSEAIESLELLYHESRELTNKSVNISKSSQAETSHQVQLWDNSEYRKMSVFPHQDELRTPDQPAKLRPSTVKGGYKDWMHYYDVQFRLLREDFTAPLRRGICGYINGLRGRELKDVRIYRNTTFCEPIATRNGVNFKVKFDISHLKRCNWAHSKRLLYGSLLCFSNDQFKNIIFATVTNRDLDELNDGIVTVEVQKNAQLLEHCTHKTEFIMIESSAYFEASRHVMASLQTAEIETMPFTQYLIANECGAVALPHYLQQKKHAFYDLSCSLMVEGCKSTIKDSSGSTDSGSLSPSSSEEDNQVLESNNTVTINILDDQSWYLEDTHLDSSQLKALKMALTQEISLIQGPPGTGKTYIGIKIVQALLANKSHWRNDENSPILVMCYTNHALDQFLEGILEAVQARSEKPPKIIRVGGRSRSEKLEQFSLAKKRKNIFLPREERYTKGRDERKFYKKKESLQKELDLLKQISSKEKNNFLLLDEVKSVINSIHLYQLLDSAETTDEQKKALEIWLGLWEKTENVQAQFSLNEEGDSTIYETDSTHPRTIESDLSTHSSTCSKVGKLEAHASLSVDLVQEASTEGEPTSEQEVLLLEAADHDHELATMSEMTTDKREDECKNAETTSESLKENSDDVQEHAILELIDFQGEGTRANDERILDDEVDEKIQTAQMDGTAFTTITSTDTSLRKMQNYEQVLKNGLLETPLQEDEVKAIRDVMDITDMKKRWKLYNFWRQKLLPSIEEDCEEEITEFMECCEKLNETQKKLDKFVLETAEILGMTTTGVAKYQHILHMVKPRIVIVEEAAEVLESHIVSALNAGTQHLILIGDHKQLKPKPNEFHLAKNYNMDVSLFERLIRNEFPYATLNIQHRMRPEIANLVRPLIYRDLQDHKSVQEYEHIKGMQKNLFFIQHQHIEGHDDNLLSYSNEYEAEYLVSTCKYLLLQGFLPKQITILTTYTGQLLKLRSLLPKSTFNGVTIQTVDNYQGEENDIVLLSLVRSNKDGKIGFLKEENRVCVSISRAKKGFYCIGNFSSLVENSLLWKRMLENLEQNEQVGQYLPLCCANHPETVVKAITPDDFQKLAPEGGCQLACQFRLECGHVCARKCHTDNSDHIGYICRKSCMRKCPNNHICPKLCFKPCAKCVVRVTRTLPKCDHQKEMLCYENPSSVKCLLKCKNTCPQGHSCPLECYRECRKCELKIPKLIPKCQHVQMVPCHQDPTEFKCEDKCLLSCQFGHPCLNKCGESCGACSTVIEKFIPECSHKVLLPCSVDPIRINCPMPCEKVLNCGHKCQSKCGERCTLNSLCGIKIVKQLSCGHNVEVPCYQDQMNIGLGFGITQTPFVKCKKQCKKILTCNHLCTNLCYQPCTEKCKIVVDKILPCGHKVQRKCYQTESPEKTTCKQTCEQKLLCGHSCTLKCGEPCNCFVPIQLTLPCGHSCSTICGEVQNVICKVKIEKSLPCGHSVQASCGETRNLICKVKIKKSLPCGHSVQSFCGETRNLICKFKMKKTLPCGHSIQSFCGEKRNFLCTAKVLRTLPCGHKKKLLCHEDIRSLYTQNCEAIIPKILPCGHTKSLLCHIDVKFTECDTLCKSKLACGHRCSGICRDCTQTRFHKPCSYGFDLQQFCGHRGSVQCVGMGDAHPGKKKKHLAKCIHQSCTHNCSSVCLPCEEPCPWICHHHECTKHCHELCDRPPCNEKCSHLLKCGHLCAGVCGEPCIAICPKCQPKKFNKLLVTPSHFEPQHLYLQLNCTHIFSLDFLDKHVEQVSESADILPPCCPKCQQPLTYNYRYGNACKKHLVEKCAVEDTIHRLTTQYLGEEKALELESRLEKLKSATLHGERRLVVALLRSRALVKIRDQLALKDYADINPQEYFLATFLVNFLEVVLAEPQSTDLTKEWSTYLKQLLETKSQLSAQIITDLSSELYRLSLKQQVMLIKKDESTFEQLPVASEVVYVEQCLELEPPTRVDATKYTECSTLLKKAFEKQCQKIFPVDSERLVRDIEESTPPNLKGIWKKCSQGHFYCTPLTIGKKPSGGCKECQL